MALKLKKVKILVLAAMFWPLNILSITINYSFLIIPFFSKLDITNKRKLIEVSLFLVFLMMSWVLGIIWFAEPGYILRGSASSFAAILPFTLLLFKIPFTLSTIKKSIIIVSVIYGLLVVYHMINSLEIPFFYADGAKSRLQPFVPDWPQRYVTLLGIALLFLIHKFKSGMNIYSIFCFLVISYAFYMTFTRTAYLAFFISLIFYFIPLKPKLSKTGLKYFLISLVVFCSVLLVDYNSYQFSIQFFDKISSKFFEAFDAFKEGTDERSVSERFDTWKEILRFTFSNNPITGTGGIGAGVLKNQGLIDIPHNSAHSQYFDLFLRYGLVGLVFFFYFFKRIFYFLGKEIKACIIFILLFSVTHETFKLTYIMLFFITMINLSYDRNINAPEL